MNTPLVSRKLADKLPVHLVNGVQRFNRAAAQDEAVDPSTQQDDQFDEEKEQALLEEARKKKERAKKMREMQEKMLAEVKAKKEAKEKQEEEKRNRYEKQLKAAREQVKANYEMIEQQQHSKEKETPDTDKRAQKPPKFVNDDKACLQAPDDSPSKQKVVKKEFIEPNLKAFMERNIPKLQVFLNITDMPTWKKKHKVADDAKVFIVTGGYGFLKKTLRRRGWVENKDANSPCFDLKWTLRAKDIDHNSLQHHQLVNHFPKAQAITTKVGLMHNLKNLIWFNNIDIETFYPRCYDLSLQEEQEDFEQEFKAVKAECIVKRFIRELTESAMSEEGEIKTTVKQKTIECAIRVCERRLKDLNELIDDPKAFEKLVSDAEWRILGADELDERKLKNHKHEKWLSSQNMSLPPKPNNKKKKKKKQKPDTPIEERGQSSDSESDISDGEEDDAIIKAICKKFPEYKTCVNILSELKQQFP